VTASDRRLKLIAQSDRKSLSWVRRGPTPRWSPRPDASSRRCCARLVSRRAPLCPWWLR